MLLEFKFKNVIDLIETLPVPPSCPEFLELSNGATIKFTGLTNGGLTWNYEIVSPSPQSFVQLISLFPCALTSFVSCTSNPPPIFCSLGNFAGICGFLPEALGILTFIINPVQLHSLSLLL